MDEFLPEWYVVRTQPKRERIAACALRDSLGLEVLCPLVKYQKVTRRGKVWWSEGMFPGYIFAKFSRREHGRSVRYAQGVLTVVQFGESVPSVPEYLIQRISEQLGADEQLILSHRVLAGDHCEIANGPLAGQTGEVLEVLPGVERVRLMVEIIGGEREVEVDLISLLLPARPNEMPSSRS